MVDLINYQLLIFNDDMFNSTVVKITDALFKLISRGFRLIPPWVRFPLSVAFF